MFKVTRWTNTGNWSITDEYRNFLHTDGEAYYRCGEYWPTRELAQAVLDKYQPPHVWEHGDVFSVLVECGHDIHMMFVHITHDRATMIRLSDKGTLVQEEYPDYLKNATFLFNIREKL